MKTTLTITELPSGRFELRDRDTFHGNYSTYADAHRSAHTIALNLRRAGRSCEITKGTWA